MALTLPIMFVDPFPPILRILLHYPSGLSENSSTRTGFPNVGALPDT
jgi:hypothetical protein